MLLAGLPQAAKAWVPVVELKFESNANNSGSTQGAATLSATTPSYVTNVPISGGSQALDFGSTEGRFYADLTSNALNAVKSLKSFTITGWVNCRSAQTNYGGGRIVSWYKNAAGYGGVDLAFRSDGSLGLGVNSYNDDQTHGITSSEAKITVDAATSYNNWRFFAVSYDGTQSTDNVKFYFGTNYQPATLDRTISLNRGTTAENIAPSLTVGNVPSHQHSAQYPFTSVFRGLIDQVRIYTSTTNASGVLDLDQILSLQQAQPLVNVPGVVYEQWNGIPGNTLSALYNDPRYPYNPSITKLQGNFEGFVNTADNYGARVSGWVKAPTTGSYIFRVVGDDNTELRVSTDANPANKRLVASVSPYNANPDSWTQFPSQVSEPVTLQANQYYYVEALVKEGGGNDFVRVGWQLPNGNTEWPIPQSRVVTTPPDAVPFYPSVYPLYEPGTFAKKATVGWHKEEGNDHFYIKTDETEALVVQNGAALIPHRLNFGPGGLIGLRWYHDEDRNFDYITLGTGHDGTPQFDALKLRRTPNGVDGVEFPMGLDFPMKEYELDGTLWRQSGMADEMGVTFYKNGEFPSSTTDEDGALSAARVGFNYTIASTEVEHEYTRQINSELVASELRLSETYLEGEAAPVVSTGAMSAFRTEFQNAVQGTQSTTDEVGRVSANNAEFTATFRSTEPDHEYTTEKASKLDANEVKFSFNQNPEAATPFIESSALGATGASFTVTPETGLYSTTTRTTDVNVQRVELAEIFNSTEPDHEYNRDTRATLEKNRLRISETQSGPHQTTTVVETVVEPGQVVTGTVVAHNLVTTPKWRVASEFPDYVFRKDYDLKSIEEVEAFARKHHHLPHFPSAAAMAEKGVDLTAMNLSLLRTVEELTLHLASLKKEMRKQQEEMESMKQGLKQKQQKQQGKAGIR